MGTRVVKLSFSAPVHFGCGRLFDSEYSCDAATLFSALFVEALRVGTAGLLLEAARSNAISISDAFPFIGSTFYLPKPMAAPHIEVQSEQRGQTLEQDSSGSLAKKALKKLRFIRAERYHDYFLGAIDPVSELERFELGRSVLQTKVNLTRENKDAADPYPVGSFSYNEGAGLYFLIQGSYDLSSLLEHLQYSGIGGERSSGYGRFGYQISEENPLPVCLAGTGSGRFVLLASAAPTAQELTDHLLAGARYTLKRKGGFVQSLTHSDTPQKKRDFYTFAAGSVFSRRFAGDIFDVNPKPGAHPVHRYAKALWMEV